MKDKYYIVKSGTGYVSDDLFFNKVDGAQPVMNPDVNKASTWPESTINTITEKMRKLGLIFEIIHLDDYTPSVDLPQVNQISSVAEAHIKKLEQSGQIQTWIQEGISSTIKKQIDNAFSSYGFQEKIKKKFSGEVSKALETVDFSVYNGFIVEIIGSFLDSEVKRDIFEKLKGRISKDYFKKVKEIKLSEIFEKINEYMNKTVEESEQWEAEGYFKFTCERHYEYDWYEFKVNKAKDASDYHEIRFVIHAEKDDKNTGWMSREVTFSGMMDELEVLFAMLSVNKTKIIFDIYPDECENYASYDAVDM